MSKEQWEHLYRTVPPEKLSWYQKRLSLSLRWIQELGLPKTAAIIDVGGGASTLVDDLLALGYRNITVLDISEEALEIAKARLGERAKLVQWIVADITQIELVENSYDLWHDRACFHFLVTDQEIAAYRINLHRALRPRGYAIIATFAPEAPLLQRFPGPALRCQDPPFNA